MSPPRSELIQLLRRRHCPNCGDMLMVITNRKKTERLVRCSRCKINFGDLKAAATSTSSPPQKSSRQSSS